MGGDRACEPGPDNPGGSESRIDASADALTKELKVFLDSTGTSRVAGGNLQMPRERPRVSQTVQARAAERAMAAAREEIKTTEQQRNVNEEVRYRRPRPAPRSPALNGLRPDPAVPGGPLGTHSAAAALRCAASGRRLPTESLGRTSARLPHARRGGGHAPRLSRLISHTSSLTPRLSHFVSRTSSLAAGVRAPPETRAPTKMPRRVRCRTGGGRMWTLAR